MNILIVAATEPEIASIRDVWFRKHHISYLVTGIGMVATSYSLSVRLLEERYDLVINCGLAGSFDRSLKLGEVVHVAEDIFSELGAEDGDQFLTLKEIGLEGIDILINVDEIRPEIINKFKRVRAITVNTIHGNIESIQKVQNRLHPQIETMEGAAVFFVCGKLGISSIQIRAISNYVEKRNKSEWNIPLAIENLKTSLADVLNRI